MTPEISFHPIRSSEKPVFSVVIPSWNNLQHLACCVESIRKNSTYAHQIIVHVNEGNDGTREWVQAQGLDHTFSASNAGVCYGFNAPSHLARATYLVLSDDDFYFAPRWDYYLLEAIEKAGTNYWCISGTMIEHTLSRNTCAMAPFDFGKTVDKFDEQKFLKEFDKIPFADWSGSNWYPLVLPRGLWTAIGGLSVEFSPGMGSDPDMMMKLWHAGVRYFKGVSASRVYHFGSKTTKRIVHNNANRQFLEKWNVSISTLYKFYLKMGKPFEGPAAGPSVSSEFKMRLLRDRIKKSIGLS
ncbi:MAG: glycosyltransferase [Cyclobacteriaceae bacterium]|nr:glycosyltransferase [Cyclobacteriaceae bacterium]